MRSRRRTILLAGAATLTLLPLVIWGIVVGYQAWKLRADWTDYRSEGESDFLWHEDQAVDLALEKIQSKDPADRKAAATALVSLALNDREYLLPDLEVLANDTLDVRLATEESLLMYYRSFRPTADGVLMKFPAGDLRSYYMESDSLRIRQAAAESMSRCPGATLDDADSMLKHEFGAIRKAGVALVLNQESSKAAHLFAEILVNGDFDMRLTALTYDNRWPRLVESKEPMVWQVVRAAVRRAVSDPEPRISSEALNVLRRRGSTADRVCVLTILKARRRGVHDTALEAFGYIGTPNDAAYVKPYLHDPSDVVRSAAIRCLCNLGASGASSYVELGLKDSSPIVRMTAAKTLWNSGGPSTFAVVATAYSEEDSEVVRGALGYALLQHGDKSSIELLRSLQANATPAARDGIANIIRKLSSVDKAQTLRRDDRRWREPWE